MLFSQRWVVALAALHGVVAIASPVGDNSTIDNAASNLTVALVRTPPPNWPLPLLNYDYTGIMFNISECVDAGIALIHDAKSRGADALIFPELWFPG